MSKHHESQQKGGGCMAILIIALFVVTILLSLFIGICLGTTVTASMIKEGKPIVVDGRVYQVKKDESQN